MKSICGIEGRERIGEWQHDPFCHGTASRIGELHAAQFPAFRVAAFAPTGHRHLAQGCRVLAATLGLGPQHHPVFNPNGVATVQDVQAEPRWGSRGALRSQGSRGCAATLGFRTKPRWG